MLKISTNVSGLKELQKELDRVENILNMKQDNKFNQFLKDKFIEVAKKVTDERLVGGSTDDEYIEEYKIRHKIENTENGFILYNDTVIPTSMLPISPETAKNYPNGFSVALAFEYGIGITGEGTYDGKYFTPWSYNVNKHNFAWTYEKDGQSYSTYGYMGFEIYRYIAEEINNNLVKWYDEYYRKVV